MAAVVVALLASGAPAQERGFAVHRYDGSTAGSWLFMVDRPWYSNTRFFAVGVTADGALNPLVPTVSTGRGAATPLISLALLGHVDLAGSFLDRVLLRASLPITLLERGTAEPVSGAQPLTGVALGDPRAGLLVRLFGQPDRDGVSLSLGGDVWFPVGGQAKNEGDRALRFLPRVVLAGAAGKARWTVDAGFLIRSYASIGPPALGMTAASEGRLGFGFGFAVLDERLYFGPEVQFSSQVFGANAFKVNGMSLEVLGGAQVLLGEHVQLGIAAGAGFLGAAGTPDARALVRLAWAPRRAFSVPLDADAPLAPTTGVQVALTEDADDDGVPNVEDRCPFEPETKNGLRDRDGCPEYELPKGSPLVRVLTAKRSRVVPVETDLPDVPLEVAPLVRDAGVKAVASMRDAGVRVLPPLHDPEPLVRDAGVKGLATARDAGSTVVVAEPPVRDAGVSVIVTEPPVRDAGVSVIATEPRARDAGTNIVVLEPPVRDAGVSVVVTAPLVRDAEVKALAPVRDAGTTVVAEPPRDVPENVVAVVDAAPDSDGDGVPDEADRCPVQPEDLDEFEDEDGCPELDNDHDGLADVADRCPLEAETPNGVEDDDGCPDAAPDADKDWLADVADRCPYEPETYDGVRDDDGCPEYQGPQREALAALIAPPVVTPERAPTPGEIEAALDFGRGDADHDGVLDEADRCPVTAEDPDGFEDEDGCPELDNDDDGLADASDRCRDEAETFNGWEDDDGCPDEHQDLDSDGVAYELDRCPNESGDASDGCPHVALPKLAVAGFPGAAAPTPAPTEPTPDAEPVAVPVTADLDQDAADDEADRCPVSAEDVDGFEDEDGCPEPDNDSDGIVDAKDKCPFEAETINGVKDDDGCPDKGASKVSIEGEHVVIKGVILFTPGSAKLTASSLPLLKQVAATLKAASSLSVEIQGHTDDVGSAAKNIRLSKQRADAIRAVLIKGGVAANRLVANGYGPTRPVASNKTAKGREKNRRVEFLILGESK